MKILVYADLHADTGPDHLFSDPTKSLQLTCVEKFFSDIATLAEKHNVDAIYDLGDTFDSRSVLEVPTLDCVFDGISKLPTSAEHVRIVGNHDQYTKSTEINNGKILAHVFETVAHRGTRTLSDGTTLFYCAYPKDHAELAEWLVKESAKRRGRKILFGHFQVKGAYLSNAKLNSGIPVEALSGFDLVLLGHIHQPQSLTDRIHYVGSPFQQNWGEAGQRKRCILLDTDTLKIKDVPMTGYPEFRSVSFDDFKVASQEATEDRFTVVLKNHEEAEKFFAHPSFNRATAQYAYDVSQAAPGEKEPEKDWSFDGILRRYMEQVPPPIEMEPEEMLAIGQSISRPD